MRSWKVIFIAVMVQILNTSFAFGQDIVALTEDWPPFNFSKNGQITGYSSEIVKEISSNLDTKISISLVPWSRAYHTVMNTENHILFSAYRTPEREKLFKWVGPIMELETVLWGLKQKQFPIRNLDDAKKYKIVVQKDSAYEKALKDQGFTDILATPSATDIEMVLQNRGDLVPLSVLALEKLKKRTKILGKDLDWVPYAILLKKPIYIAFNKNIEDQIVERWQQEFDVLSKSSFTQDLRRRFIDPLTKQKPSL